ncbi:hypothetical protein GCM10029964_010800 [Kibdelosporangium lantanae]
MKLYDFQCDTSGLPLTLDASFATATKWVGEELVMAGIRGGAIAADKQTPIQGTSVHTRRPENVDFPYHPVRAGAQGLT